MKFIIENKTFINNVLNFAKKNLSNINLFSLPLGHYIIVLLLVIELILIMRLLQFVLPKKAKICYNHSKNMSVVVRESKTGYFPKTKQSLVNDCRSVDSRRWVEFLNVYYPAVEKYVLKHFSLFDSDVQANIVQDTFIELSKTLPSFSYADNPHRKFRWHLIAVTKYKGLEQYKKQKRIKAKSVKIQYVNDNDLLDNLSCESAKLGLIETNKGDENLRIRQNIIDLVVEGLVKDESFNIETRDVFWRIMVNGEKPVNIAKELHVSRDTIDHMKSRMMKKFKLCCKRMIKAHILSE